MPINWISSLKVLQPSQKTFPIGGTNSRSIALPDTRIYEVPSNIIVEVVFIKKDANGIQEFHPLPPSNKEFENDLQNGLEITVQKPKENCKQTIDSIELLKAGNLTQTDNVLTNFLPSKNPKLNSESIGIPLPVYVLDDNDDYNPPTKKIHYENKSTQYSDEYKLPTKKIHCENKSTQCNIEIKKPHRARGTQCILIKPEDVVPPPPEPVIKKNEIEEDDFESLFHQELPPEEIGYKFIEDGRVECLKCGVIRQNTGHMNQHLQTHQQKSSLCAFCGQYYESWKGRLWHENNYHLGKNKKELKGGRIRADGRRVPNSTKEERICSYCGKYFSSIHAHKLHLNTHTGEKPYVCECGKAFASSDYLMHVHKKQHCLLTKHLHQKKRIRSKLKRNVSNETANNQTSETELSTAIKMLDDEKSPASVPNVTVPKPSKRRQKRTTFECQLCDYKATNYSALNKHKVCHVTERKFVCSECKKSYRDLNSLNSHIRLIHIATFKCKYCDIVLRRNKMAEHVRIHLGVMPFECDICKMKFPGKKKLTSHRQYTHFPEKWKKSSNIPFHCTLCTVTQHSRKRFVNHFRTPRHMDAEKEWRSKTQIQFHECLNCVDTAFYEFVDLYEHMIKSHSIQILHNMENFFTIDEESGKLKCRILPTAVKKENPAVKIENSNSNEQQETHHQEEEEQDEEIIDTPIEESAQDNDPEASCSYNIIIKSDEIVHKEESMDTIPITNDDDIIYDPMGYTSDKDETYDVQVYASEDGDQVIEHEIPYAFEIQEIDPDEIIKFENEKEEGDGFILKAFNDLIN